MNDTYRFTPRDGGVPIMGLGCKEAKRLAAERGGTVHRIMADGRALFVTSVVLHGRW